MKKLHCGSYLYLGAMRRTCAREFKIQASESEQSRQERETERNKAREMKVTK